MAWDEDDWWDGYGADIENEVDVHFDGIKAGTPDAILITVGRGEYWIPRSQIGELEKTGGRFSNAGRLTIPEWLAVEKGLA